MSYFFLSPFQKDILCFLNTVIFSRGLVNVSNNAVRMLMCTHIYTQTHTDVWSKVSSVVNWHKLKYRTKVSKQQSSDTLFIKALSTRRGTSILIKLSLDFNYWPSGHVFVRPCNPNIKAGWFSLTHFFSCDFKIIIIKFYLGTFHDTQWQVKQLM